MEARFDFRVRGREDTTSCHGVGDGLVTRQQNYEDFIAQLSSVMGCPFGS